MKCPYCGLKDDTVILTQKYDTCIVRIRKCKVCMRIYQTYEQIQERIDASDHKNL